MADLALGATRSLVAGTLAEVQSAIETEANLRQVAQSDLAFITEEFQMMQSFLEVVDERRAKNKVVKTWVGQVRDLAYDVEDGMEFVAHLDTKPDWWRRFWLLKFCMAQPLDEAVAELKQLKARVEDVSNRNIRYNLISESGFKPITQQEQQLVSSAVIGATSLDILPEVTADAKMQQDLGPLTQLIINMGRGWRRREAEAEAEAEAAAAAAEEKHSIVEVEEEEEPNHSCDKALPPPRVTNEGNGSLRVIWVRGTGGDLSFMSVVRKAYQTPDICQIFPYRGWFKLTHPFNPHEALRSLMTQFYTNSCQQSGAAIDVDKLARMAEVATTQAGLIKEFMKQANKNRYLVVLENVSTMGEWDDIRAYLPDGKNDSLIIVSTQQSEIASLGVGDSYQVLEMRQYSASVLFKEDPQGNEDDAAHKSYKRIPTYKHDEARRWEEQFTLVGRESQIRQLRNCQTMARFRDWQVMSVWGIPGVGKSALVKCLYCERMLQPDQMFNKYSWVNVSHPFNLRDFCQSLLSDLHSGFSQTRGVEDLVGRCRTILNEHPCLVVIDDVQSNEEWDLIQPALVARHSKSVIIVITNEVSIATHCADSKEVVFNLTCLEPEAAIDLFKNEVRRRSPTSPLLRDIGCSDNLSGLISKCGGIPKVIIAIADFLAPKTVTCMWSTGILNQRFMHELEGNPDLFCSVRGIFRWMDSFIRTCPDFLKRCLLYLSVFPEQQIIRRRRLVRRWIAEGYCKGESSSLEQRGEWSFSNLVDLSMIQQPWHSFSDELRYRRMVFCQVNNFVSEYIFTKPMEENLVLQLKGICRLTTQCSGRHLAIDGSWDGDMIVFESIDFSKLWSLTVFGHWKAFFVSASMKVLRVLDLEDATGVTDKDLEQIVKLLPRLKFLSLRGCTDIHHLPSSMGALRQLETLDVKYTSIVAMPVTIAKLKKLQYLRAGTAMPTEERQTASSSSRLFEFRRCQQVEGVKLAAGVEKLTALHTLGVVNVSEAGGKAILKELKKLTQLRKLGVSGINKKNIKEFCSAIPCHVHMESLSVRMSKDNQDCLDDIDLHSNLRNLKLFGFVKGLPAWIGRLQKLTKLDLEITISAEVDIHAVLGRITELCILRLHVKLLNNDDNGRLHFHVMVNGVQDRCYEKVKILDIACRSSTLHVSFGSESMQNLEVLTAQCSSGFPLQFSGLKDLAKHTLKEVRLVGFHDDNRVEEIRTQLEQHPKKTINIQHQN